VPTEEVVIRKEAVTEDRNVEADVRRERLVSDRDRDRSDRDRDVNDRR
jgi:stress response protein YsnF